MPGAVIANTKTVAHTNAPSADPMANQLAASLSSGENDIMYILRCWYREVGVGANVVDK